MINYTLSQISEALKLKKFSVHELTLFYCDRIKKINAHTNALVQINEELTLKKAKQADDLLAKGSIVGPLHGIPFTAKDWLETKDFITSAGMEERRNFKPSQNATVVDRLEAAGAILLGKTNVPYELGETNNPIYGRTNNPYHLDYSPGGSSGGEAAAITTACTGFGIGSDSGGSIRTPCHFNGIAGLKPTSGRIPSTGHYPEIATFIDPRSQIGPMARFVEDLEMVYPLLTGSDGKDPYVVQNINYKALDLSTLKIAYYSNHLNISPSADVANVLQTAIDFLQNQVRTITYEEPKNGLELVMEVTYGYWDLYKKTSSSQNYLNLLKNWDHIRHLMWEYVQPYDAIITPVVTEAAHPHGDTLPETMPYTLTYSLLGWPCATVRVGTSQNGFPINLQIVAKPFHEEICLLVAKRLEELCGWKLPDLNYVEF